MPLNNDFADLMVLFKQAKRSQSNGDQYTAGLDKMVDIL